MSNPINLTRDYKNAEGAVVGSYTMARNEGSDVAEISIVGTIRPYDIQDEEWQVFTRSARGFRKDLKALGDVKEVRMFIDSDGGDVFEGWGIYDAIAMHPAKFTAQVQRLAASMGSVIILACDEVEMEPRSRLMIHNVSGGGWGTARQIKGVAKLLEQLEQEIVEAYAAASSIPADEIKAMMDETTWMTAAEAVDLGFADRVLAAATGEEAHAKAQFYSVLNQFQGAPEDLLALTSARSADSNLKNMSDATKPTAKDRLLALAGGTSKETAAAESTTLQAKIDELTNELTEVRANLTAAEAKNQEWEDAVAAAEVVAKAAKAAAAKAADEATKVKANAKEEVETEVSKRLAAAIAETGANAEDLPGTSAAGKADEATAEDLAKRADEAESDTEAFTLALASFDKQFADAAA